MKKESEGIFYMKQKEHSAGIFGGFSRSFGKKFTLNASLAVRYYKASVDSAGKKGTLWGSGRLVSVAFRRLPDQPFEYVTVLIVE